MVEFNVDSDISFFEYKPDDYKGFVDCINDFYKGGYPYLPYLEKENLDEQVKSGKMIATVAKNKDGRIVGTSAAKRLDGVFEGSVLLLLRCVLSDYQRKGIGSRQEVFLFDLINKRFNDCLSLFADVMTHDSVSQSTLCKQGFTFCGFRMMLYKNEIICPKKNFETGTKMSQAIYCKAYVPKKNMKLYVPTEQKEFISKIYNDLKTPFEFAESKKDGNDIGYITEINPLHKTAEVHIHYSGSNNTGLLEKEVESIIDDGNTCVCYVNMCQAGACEIYETLKKHDFRFSGVKPLSTNGEYLVMSNIKNCVKSFEIIKYPEQKQELVNYILGGFKNET